MQGFDGEEKFADAVLPRDVRETDQAVKQSFKRKAGGNAAPKIVFTVYPEFSPELIKLLSDYDEAGTRYYNTKQARVKERLRGDAVTKLKSIYEFVLLESVSIFFEENHLIYNNILSTYKELPNAPREMSMCFSTSGIFSEDLNQAITQYNLYKTQLIEAEKQGYESQRIEEIYVLLSRALGIIQKETKESRNGLFFRTYHAQFNREAKTLNARVSKKLKVICLQPRHEGNKNGNQLVDTKTRGIKCMLNYDGENPKLRVLIKNYTDCFNIISEEIKNINKSMTIEQIMLPSIQALKNLLEVTKDADEWVLLNFETLMHEFKAMEKLLFGIEEKYEGDPGLTNNLAKLKKMQKSCDKQIKELMKSINAKLEPEIIAPPEPVDPQELPPNREEVRSSWCGCCPCFSS